MRQHTPVLPVFCEWRVQFDRSSLLLEEDDAGSRDAASKASKLGKGNLRAAGERAKGSVTRRAWVLVRRFGPLCVGVCRGCVGGGFGVPKRLRRRASDPCPLSFPQARSEIGSDS